MKSKRNKEKMTSIFLHYLNQSILLNKEFNLTSLSLPSGLLAKVRSANLGETIANSISLFWGPNHSI